MPLMLMFQPSQGADIEVIYTEIAADPSSIVPGALDASGTPVLANFASMLNVGISHDGSQWYVRGTTNQVAELASIVLLGSGLTGEVFAQEGQPIPGGLPGELYDFFDGPNAVSWDEQNNIGWSFRAKGGVASVFEKLAFYSAATKTQTIVLQMGDAALGLIDVPANPTGDEIFGN
ncbi:MAG: hypothetical protein L0219_12035 [Phycisphaerales bacterium]|nr:hypothetical protein [Phycisphaerales bacterium]